MPPLPVLARWARWAPRKRSTSIADGLGQVLIYPYYTARTKHHDGLRRLDAFNTLISVVNSTASAKAVKVRFLESLDSPRSA